MIYHDLPMKTLRFSRAAGGMGLAAAPKAAGGGHREGDPVAFGDGDDSTGKFGMIYYWRETMG